MSSDQSTAAPTAVIADDEPNLSRHLSDLLKQAWPELQILDLARSGEEAQNLIEKHHPQIAFLDIRMPKPDGLELAQIFASQLHIVFVTAYDQYAVQAFDQAAVDYLLKPISRDRIASTVKRLKNRLVPSPEYVQTITQLAELLDPKQNAFLQNLRVDHRGTTLLLDVNDISMFQADMKYTKVYVQDGNYLLRTTLTELEKSLDPSKFWRVHRNTIVNSKFIEFAKRGIQGRYQIQLKNHSRTVGVSRTYSHLFKPQ